MGRARRAHPTVGAIHELPLLWGGHPARPVFSLFTFTYLAEKND
jgi:hypothetical protein